MWQKYSRVRLIYKRSSTLTKVLVLVAVVFSTVTLLGLRSLTLKAEARNAEVLNQIGTQEQENAKLKEKTDAAGTLEGI